jgi:hypothetical protein
MKMGGGEIAFFGWALLDKNRTILFGQSFWSRMKNERKSFAGYPSQILFSSILRNSAFGEEIPIFRFFLKNEKSWAKKKNSELVTIGIHM